ncbi:hypothetical protein ACHAPT_012131 [Fusarium lateritium]
MSDRVQVRYSYKGIEEYEDQRDSLRGIIQQDTGAEDWRETRSMPPIGFPPPLSPDSVKKLKDLDGVNIEELKYD